MKWLLSFFMMCFCSINTLDAQIADTLPTKKKFNPEKVKLLFGINYKVYTPVVGQNDIYRGEQRQRQRDDNDNNNDDRPLEFVDYHNKTNLAKDFSASNLQFNLQANFWKNLYNGIHYQFFTIKNYKRPGRNISKTNSLFFAVATSVGYAFEFLKNKNMQVMPSFRIGGYTADEYYDAKGRKLYLGLDCKLSYFIKNKFGFSASVDYDYFRYKSKGYSEIFQSNTTQKTTLNNFYLSIGIIFKANIKLEK
jgi:hypothetical protein